MKKSMIFLAVCTLLSAGAYGQIGINVPDPDVTLHVSAKNTDGSTSEGFLAPRMTGDNLHVADLNGVYGQPQDGTICFVTAAPTGSNRIGQTIDIDSRGYYYYDFPANRWLKVSLSGSTGVVTDIDCANANIPTNLTAGQPVSGVTADIPYNGGNGGTYGAQTVQSSGVTGLYATLAAGNLENGSGQVTYTITGTPSAPGTASFAISLGGKLCTLDVPVGEAAAVVNLQCTSAVITGSLKQNQAASGVFAQVPYTSGNGGAYPTLVFNSTGVPGLIARINAGSVNSGNGTATFLIEGTPSVSGTASFQVTFGGQTCSFSIPVSADVIPIYPAGTGSLAGKTCFDVVMVNDGGDCGELAARQSLKADFSQTATHTQTYTFTPTGTVSNVRFLFENTNGTVIQTISGDNPGNNISTPVTATVIYNSSLNALASGLTRDNALTAKIRVIYNDNATGSGIDKELSLTVNVQDCNCCGAYVAAGVWKEFMCHNLGADQSADPFTPSAAIHGAKYQWGRKNPGLSQAQDQAQAGAISGWNVYAPINSWQDATKTANDPCPAGYRVPTRAQWQGVTDNNVTTKVGPFTDSPTNYSSGQKIGNALFLPAAGYRNHGTGLLFLRGSWGGYWGSTVYDSTRAYYMYYNTTTMGVVAFNISTYGFSVRCISE